MSTTVDHISTWGSRSRSPGKRRSRRTESASAASTASAPITPRPSFPTCLTTTSQGTLSS